LKALGALTVIGAPGSPFEGEEFNVGGGFDAKERIDLWLVRETLIGRIVKVKHFPIGAADKPRHPIFLGWRDARDMG
jgi:DNA ligase-1